MIRTRLLLILLAVFSLTILAERTKLAPGRNVFSPQQDVELGRDAAKDAERQLDLINDSKANAYLGALGQQLVSKAPNEYKFPFYFKIVNDKSINAFALPGGPIYVHRGAIEAADNEAQIAGVIGHEIGHVVLRHGTNQATKAQFGQGALGILGAVLGNGAVGQIVSAGGGFLANSVFLKYSRDAESQSDLIGTQILYDLGYDPHAMAEFFDKLAKDHKGTKSEEFFSNHPIPENRVAKVNAEIQRLGPMSPRPRLDSPDFQEVKKIMLGWRDPSKRDPKAATSNNTPARAPAAPSTRYVDFNNAGIRLRHPDNWKSAVQGNHATIAPEGGAINGNLAYGVIVDTFQPQSARDLDQATTQLLNELKRGNPSMQISRSRSQTKIGGSAALLTEVLSDSPAGGQETDYVVTTTKSSSEVLYFVFVAPSSQVSQYKNAFNSILDSIRLR
jgi:Zn-dependent protease with chaperone function